MRRGQARSRQCREILSPLAALHVPAVQAAVPYLNRAVAREQLGVERQASGAQGPAVELWRAAMADCDAAVERDPQEFAGVAWAGGSVYSGACVCVCWMKGAISHAQAAVPWSVTQRLPASCFVRSFPLHTHTPPSLSHQHGPPHPTSPKPPHSTLAANCSLV